MSVEVRNRGSEPVENLLRRFTKRWQQSGIGQRERERRHYRKPETRRERRIKALYRLSMRKEREHLRKLGKLDDERGRYMVKK